MGASSMCVIGQQSHLCGGWIGWCKMTCSTFRGVKRNATPGPAVSGLGVLALQYPQTGQTKCNGDDRQLARPNRVLQYPHTGQTKCNLATGQPRRDLQRPCSTLTRVKRNATSLLRMPQN